MSQNERWTFGHARLKVAERYLGVTISTRLSFQSTMRDLVERERNDCLPMDKIL